MANNLDQNAKEQNPYLSGLDMGSEYDICIGDQIALYSEDKFGYVFSYQSSSVHNELGVAPKQDERQPNIRCAPALLFEICAQNRYKAQKKLPKLREAVKRKENDYKLLAALASAEKTAEAEMSDNALEQKRQQGKTVFFGQVVQLRHKFTRKFVHVNTTQTAWTETSNLLTELLPTNGKKAQFKILPRYKVKSEGEAVQSNDLIILESVKSPGQYLHCSRIPFPDTCVYHDNFELNLSVIPSGFSIKRYRSRRKQDPAARLIMGGSTIRLFHKELEGYMTAEGAFGQTISENGTEITWDDQIHLLHMTTRQYLQLDGEMKATLTPDRNSPMTVFRLHPLDKANAKVEHKSYVRIEHVYTGYWLHGNQKKSYVRQERQIATAGGSIKNLVWSNSKLSAIEGAEMMMYDDAYTIQLVEPDNLMAIKYASGILPYLHKLLIEFHHAVYLTPRRMARVTGAMEELKQWIQVNGKSNKNRQKLLRDYKVVDVLIELLKCNAEDAKLRDFILRVHSLSYVILRLFLEGKSTKNELYLAKHIEFFIDQASKQTEVGKKAAYTLMELLKDNRAIISLLKEDQICLFVKLLTKNKFYRYLELLSVMCIENGITLPDNQLYITKQWLNVYPKQGYNMCHYMSMGQDIGLERDVPYISTDKKKTWLPLVDFLKKRKDPQDEEVLFLIYQLQLFVSLCRGRNAEAIRIITEYHFSWGLAFHLLQNNDVPDHLRIMIADIIQHLFVDVGDSFSMMDRVKLVFIYDQIPLPGEPAKETKNDGSKSLVSVMMLPPALVKSMKDWISHFFKRNEVMIAQNVTRNRFIEKVLNLMGSLVNFGYYGDTEHIHEILEPIERLMNGKSDTEYKVDTSTSMDAVVKENIARYQNEGRFEVTRNNDALADVKFAAMRVLDMFLNFRFNSRLHRFIQDFKEAEEKQVEDALKFFEKFEEDTEDEEEFRNNLTHHKTAKRRMVEVFKETDYFGQPMLDVLKDLLNYKYNNLVTQALILINRIFSANENVFNLAWDTQLLLTNESIESFRTISLNTSRLRLAKKNKWTEEIIGDIVEILEELSKECSMNGSLGDLSDPHPLNQEMMLNYGLLGDMFFFLVNFASSDSEFRQWTVIEKNLLRNVLNFLRLMARDQNEIQERLFARLDSLLAVRPCDTELGEMLIEVFKKNNKNCLKIQMKQIKTIVERYTETANPIWLSLLSCLVTTDNFPIKRNQNLVVKALMTYQKSLSVVTDSTPEKKMKYLAMNESMRNDVNEEGSKKSQLSGLVYLLSVCSMGENVSIESICQCLLTMDELLTFVNMSKTALCDGLRLPFVNFLTFGYLYSYSNAARNELANCATDERLMSFIKGCVNSLQEGIQIIQSDPQSALVLLRYRSAHLHRSSADLRHEQRESLLYIFEGVIPFLYALYERHWKSNVIIEEQDTRAILAALHNFAETSIPSITRAHHRTSLLNTLRLISLTTNIPVNLPQELHIRMDTNSADQNRYNQYYKNELILKDKFDNFARNMRLAYEGRNTVRHQLNHPIDEEYTALNSEECLPLGEEFHNFVNFFLHSNDGKKSYKKDYEIVGILRHLAWSAQSRLGKSERQKLELDNLDIKVLKVIRAMIHNELMRLPKEKASNPTQYSRVMKSTRYVQQSLDRQGLINSVIPNLRVQNQWITRECFNLLNMLYKGNSDTPENLVLHVDRNHDDSFFIAVKTRLTSAAALIKEQKFAASLFQRNMKNTNSLAKTMKGKTAESRLSRGPSRLLSQPKALLSKGLNATGISKMNNAFKGLLGVENEDDGLKLVTFNETKDDAPPASPVSVPVPKGNFETDGVPLIQVDETTVNPSEPSSPATPEDAKMKSMEGPMGEGPVGDMAGPDMSAYQDLGDIKVVIRTLQSLCDLEFSRAQDLMREQPENVNSVNLVAEVCYLLSLLYTDIDSEKIELVCDLLETIVEFVQGNHENQAVVFDSKVIDHINHMLRIEDFLDCEQENILRFKQAIATVIRFMTEENQPAKVGTHLTKAFLMAVNEEGLWHSALDCYKRAASVEDREQKQFAVDIAYQYYFIIRRSIDLGLSHQTRYEPAAVWEDFEEKTLTIEFLKSDVLQRLYFKTNDRKALRAEVEEKLKWEVDRSSYGNKMRDFMNWIKDIHADIRAQRRIHSTFVGRFLVRQFKVFNYTILISTLIMNIMILAIWDENTHRDDPSEDFWLYHHQRYDLIWRFFGVLHNVAAFCLVVSYFLSNAAGFQASWQRFWNSINRYRKKLIPIGEDENQLKTERISKLEVSFIGSQVIYYMVYMIFSILGTMVTPAFFAFHLFQIVQNNQLLARVIRAVTLNGRSLFYVAMLGLIIIYMFGLIAFLTLRNVYQGNLHFCESLYKCTLSTIREGLVYKLTRIDYPVKRKWGLNAAGDPWAVNDNENFTTYGLKLIWDICYWVLVITIGLNVIFGIIVDTFRQLRDAKWRIEQDIEARCFICGRSSYEFEQRGIAFRDHCNIEHNILSYVFFFVKLQDMANDELSHLEMYLKKMAAKENFNFFPMNQAMCLKDKDSETMEMERELVIINLLHQIMDMLNEEKLSRQKNLLRAAQKEWVTQLGRTSKASSIRSLNNPPLKIGARRRGKRSSTDEPNGTETTSLPSMSRDNSAEDGFNGFGSLSSAGSNNVGGGTPTNRRSRQGSQTSFRPKQSRGSRRGKYND